MSEWWFSTHLCKQLLTGHSGVSGMNLEGKGRGSTALAIHLAIKKDLYPRYRFSSPKAVTFILFFKAA